MIQALRSGLHYPPKDIEAEIEAIHARKAAMKEKMEARKTKSESETPC